MNKHFKEGRSHVIFTIPHLALPIGNYYAVTNSEHQPFPVNALVEFAPAIKPWDDDEEHVPEHLEFVSVYLLQPLFLSSDIGVSAHINTSCNLLELISDAQYETWVLNLKKQAAQGLL
jgi:hypothetical protein